MHTSTLAQVFLGINVLGGFLGAQQGSTGRASGSKRSETQQEGGGVWEGRKGGWRREFLTLAERGCPRRRRAEVLVASPHVLIPGPRIKTILFCFKTILIWYAFWYLTSGI